MKRSSKATSSPTEARESAVSLAAEALPRIPANARPLTAGDLPMAVFFHVFYLGLPVAFIATPLVLLCTSRWWMGVAWLLGYAAWFARTSSCERDGRGMPWPLFEQCALFQLVFSWFPLCLEPTFPLDAGLYIFAAHPHGALAFNRALFGWNTQMYWSKAFPGIDFRVLCATAALRVPVIRELWMWSYCIDASKAVAQRALRRGTSLFLYPGGEKEQILTKRGEHRLYLLKRKGFVKLALQHGASLVPVYVFGETDLYDHSSFLLGARKWAVANLGAAFMLVSGSFGLLPYRVPVTAVSGAPIPVKQVDQPSQEQIDELHATYVSALRKLFDEHKVRLGYPDAKLEVN